MKFLAKICGVSLLITIIASCGPPLTQPSSVNITGHWTATAPIGPLSDVQMDISQSPDGTVAGQWSGTIASPNPPCPPGLGSSPTGSVNGTNTILEVRLSLLGAGDFDGQAIDGKTLKGSFESCGTYAIVFSQGMPASAAR